jgi:hypothetical protein
VPITDAIRLGFAKDGDGWDSRQTVDGTSTVPDGSTSTDGTYTGVAPDAQTGTYGQYNQPESFDEKNLPGYEKYNYPRLLEFINEKLSALGCSASQLPFRVVNGPLYSSNNDGLSQQMGVTGITIGQWGAFSSTETPAAPVSGKGGNIMTILFSCGGIEGSDDCVQPEKHDSMKSSPWEWTKYQFVFQLLVPLKDSGANIDTNYPVMGRSTGVSTFTWDCENEMVKPLKWCGGKVGHLDLDGIVREAIAKMRFGVVKAIAANPSRSSYLTSYDACSDESGCTLTKKAPGSSWYDDKCDNINYHPVLARKTCRKKCGQC